MNVYLKSPSPPLRKSVTSELGPNGFEFRWPYRFEDYEGADLDGRPEATALSIRRLIS